MLAELAASQRPQMPARQHKVFFDCQVLTRQPRPRSSDAGKLVGKRAVIGQDRAFGSGIDSLHMIKADEQSVADSLSATVPDRGHAQRVILKDEPSFIPETAIGTL